MIGLKTVFNYIKFANELINKIFFMFNGIKKYVVRIVCVIMLLLVQFDVCAPLIDANLAMVETMEQPTLPSDLSLIHISEPTRQAEISYAVFCLKKKNKTQTKNKKKQTDKE